MTPLFLDYETYWSKDFSIRKMSPLLYVRDPRFKAHGASVATGLDEDPYWLTANDLVDFLAKQDWPNTLLVSHNYNFDGLITHEKYGISPGARCDTLALCRTLLSHDLDFDLDNISKTLGYAGKLDGGQALLDAKDIRDLPPDVERRLGLYANNDVKACREIFKLLWSHLPEHERQVMNIILRYSTQGILRTDHDQFDQVETAILTDRQTKLDKVGVNPTELRSRPKFAALLQARGVQPPMKESPTTGKPTFAFAKTDVEFMALRDNLDVADLIEAKLVWADNNAISRIKTIRTATSLPPNTLPVLCNVSGAHTHRVSGGGKINMCNLNRKGGLRDAIIAPPGHVIVVRDQKGIELRLNMWFSGQYDILELIRQGGDVYLLEASRQYGIPFENMSEETHPDERQFGKIVELGAGYQMGGKRFRAFCAVGPLGLDPIYLTPQQSFDAIASYRNRHPFVVDSWNFNGHIALPQMVHNDCNLQRGPIIYKHEAIELPNGLKLQYPNLRYAIDEETGNGNWIWGINGRIHKLYGGIMQENEIQSLAGEIIKEDMVKIDHELQTTLGCGVVHQVYDELLSVVPERDATDVSTMMGEIMSRPRDWAPGLPLASSGGYAYRYGKCSRLRKSREYGSTELTAVRQLLRPERPCKARYARY